MSEIFCDICASQAEELPSHRPDGAHQVQCLSCGIYHVANQWRAAKMVQHLKADERLQLSGVVRSDTDEFGRCGTVISQQSFRQLIARHNQPRGALEQMERFILLAAESAAYFGAASDFDSNEAVAARLYLPAERETVERFMSAMKGTGLLERSGGSFACELTLEGWQFAEKLRQAVHVGSQAFVAMWFSPSMDAAFDEGFAPALGACGYKPYRVDREKHNNKIDDQIVANIRKSRLLVADLTGLRPNVFYEAGFAHGLGIPWLLTCHETEVGRYVQEGPGEPSIAEAPWATLVEQRAFDVRQYLVMRWSTPADLAAKLQNRIEALALALKGSTG